MSDDDMRSQARSSASHLDIPDPSSLTPGSIRSMIDHYRKLITTPKWNKSLYAYLAARRKVGVKELDDMDKWLDCLSRVFFDDSLVQMNLAHADLETATVAYHIGTTALALFESLPNDVIVVLSEPVKCLRTSTW